MQWILWVMATNTVLALVPAGLALLAAWRKRPALAHVLWLLVLVKLVLPPVWNVPLLAAPRAAAPTAAIIPAPAPEVQPALPATNIRDVAAHGTYGDGAMPATPAMNRAGGVAPAAIAPGLALTSAAPARVAVSGSVLLAVVWLGGSGFILLLAAVRVARFRGALSRVLIESPALEGQVKEIARRLGVRRPPAARLGPAGMSPMIWFVGGRPLLILPENMMVALSTEQRAAILAHELAHLKRLDHWVRLFEMAATVLLWWHPLLWLARLGLRASEEHACDALVLETLGDPRAYAAALVEAMHLTTTSAPAYVSGLGGLKTIKRRLDMILETTPRKRRRYGGWMLVAAVAASLPFAPTRGRAATPAPAVTSAPEARAAEASATPPVFRAAIREENGFRAMLEVVHPDGSTSRFQVRPDQGVNWNGLTVTKITNDALTLSNGAVISIGQDLEKRVPLSRPPALLEYQVSPTSPVAPDPATAEATATAVRALLELASEELKPDSKDVSYIQAALDAVGVMGPKAVPALCDSLKSANPTTRTHAMMLLGALRPAADESALPAMLEGLKDSDRAVRQSACDALGRDRTHAARIVPAVLPLLEDKEQQVKLAAIRALVEIHADPKLATPGLIKALKDNDDQVRVHAAFALGWINQTGGNGFETQRSLITVSPPNGNSAMAGTTVEQIASDDTLLRGEQDQQRALEKQLADLGKTLGPSNARILQLQAQLAEVKEILEQVTATRAAHASGTVVTLTARGMEAAKVQAEQAVFAAKVQAAQATLANIQTALAIFEVDHARYPTTAEGLAALASRPKDMDATWQKTLDAVPKDPWGNDFIYRSPAANRDYELKSVGPDGKPGTADDIGANAPIEPATRAAP